MNKAIELFKKVFVDGQEIDLQELDTNGGVYNVGEQKENIKVDFVLKNKNEIPSYLFSNLKDLNSVILPKTINSIGSYAFSNSNISYINGDFTYITHIGNGAFSYTNIKEINKFSYINTSYINNIESIFEGTYLNTYFTYSLGNMFPNSKYVSDQNTEEQIKPNTGTLDVDYQVGYKYTLPLIYTERSGQKRIQEIGTVKIQIIDINENEEEASQYKLKIKVIEVNITNPLSNVNINYENEILNKYFYTQETFITADIDMFITLPGFTGIESFFAMKGEGDTYHPELENLYGVTDYSIKRNTLELIPEIDNIVNAEYTNENKGDTQIYNG